MLDLSVSNTNREEIVSIFVRELWKARKIANVFSENDSNYKRSLPKLLPNKIFWPNEIEFNCRTSYFSNPFLKIFDQLRNLEYLLFRWKIFILPAVYLLFVNRELFATNLVRDSSCASPSLSAFHSKSKSQSVLSTKTSSILNSKLSADYYLVNQPVLSIE